MTRDQDENSRRETMAHYGFGPEAMKSTRVCAVCGAATATQALRCPVCGNPLPSETLYDWYRDQHPVCPVCGSVLPRSQEIRYCPQCGSRLPSHGV